MESAPDVGGIRVGHAKTEDALKLTAFGISANDFLRLQEFLPMVSGLPLLLTETRETPEVEWKQSEFGHPGNWNDDVVDFCMSTCLNVALSIQNASPIPHARAFSDLYDYKVTAKEDQVEVWEDFVNQEKQLAEIYADNERPFRKPKRFLKRGEWVVVSAYTQPLVSKDLSLSGDEIQRVQISYDNMSSLAGLFYGESEIAEFVNLAHVQITCVPRTEEQSLALPEIPWLEEPPKF